MKAATIPMPGDLAEAIGSAAERVENRSLLLDKFVFHKSWPVAEEETSRGRNVVKWDEASRWSFMRIADGADQILRKEADNKRRRSAGKNTTPENKGRLLEEAKIAETLANTHWNTNELSQLRAQHTRRFLRLFQTAYADRAHITIGQLEGRLAINLADNLIQNAGICLDRLFGLPHIPGSAVKGVSRHAALEELKTASDEAKPGLFHAFRAVFGTADNDFSDGALRPFRHLLGRLPLDQKGAVSFLPSYPVNDAHIVVDLTNVHYPDYYRSGQESDQQKEKPKPNPFPAVEMGAQFAFCIVLNGTNNDTTLLDHARRWLENALTVRGLGAKTAAGYGWFSIHPEVLVELEEQEASAEAVRTAAAMAAAKAESARQAEASRQAALDPQDRAAEQLLTLTDDAFAAFAKVLAQKSEPEQRAYFKLLTGPKRDRWKAWRKKKPEIVKALEDARTRLNIPPLP